MKKIAFTSQGKELTDKLDSKFTRCPYFIIVTLKDNNIEVLENPAIKILKGAGEKATKFLFNKEVECIVSTNFTQNAFEVLDEAEIDILAGIEGTIEENLEAFKKGNLELWFPYDIHQKKGPTPDFQIAENMKEEELAEQENIKYLGEPPHPMAGPPPPEPDFGWSAPPPYPSEPQRPEIQSPPPPPWEGPGGPNEPAWCPPPPWVGPPEAARPAWSTPPPWEGSRPYWEASNYDWDTQKQTWGGPSWPAPPPWWQENKQGPGASPWVDREIIEEKMETLLETIEALTDEIRNLKDRVEKLENIKNKE